MLLCLPLQESEAFSPTVRIGGVHLRQFGNDNKRCSCCMAKRRNAIPLSRQHLYLPSHGSSADLGRQPAHIATGTHKRSLCDCQDCGPEALPVLSTTVWRVVSLRDADEPLRPGDNYHPDNSHVLPALIRRFHEATEQNADSVVIWGSGKPRREFLHVDDLAAGVVHLLNLENPPDLVNIGSGEEITIRAVAELIAEIVGFQGPHRTGFVQARWYSAETQRYQSNQIDWLEPSDLSEGRTEVCLSGVSHGIRQ